MVRAFVTCGAVLAVLAAVSPARANLITNGSFESGLSGWSSSSNVSTHSSYYNGITPTHGAKMAVMSYGLGPNDASLWQTFSYGPGNTHIRFTFDYNLRGWDFSLFDCDADFLKVTAGTMTLLQVTWDTIFGAGVQTQGWKTYDSGWISLTGVTNPLTLKFYLENMPPGGGDAGQKTTAFIDNVSACVVPVPPGFALFALGAAGLGWYRRRKAS